MRLRLEPDLALQIAAAVIVVLILPFCLGFIHWPPDRYLIYSGGGGLALALGDYFDGERVLPSNVLALGADALLRAAGVAILGGVVYLIAWLF